MALAAHLRADRSPADAAGTSEDLTVPVAGDHDDASRVQRLRLRDFRFRRTPSGQCSAEVELEHPDGRVVGGRASGTSSPMGDLRTAAEATIRALAAAVGTDAGFELLGVKSLRAFDATVVIVAVSAPRGGRAQQLLGCYLAEQDTIRGAVVAVLNATNRVVGNRIHTS